MVYDVFAGKRRPGRDHAIKLAFGLGCDLRETQRLLRLAGVSELWCKQRRDVIVTVVLRDAKGRIIYGDHEYVDKPAEGASKPFSITRYDLPQYASYEVYAATV
ncbi:hypothetical protein [Bifidobacterium primatium]|uniref:hypothetical protein n=1 Tax=Bifidobacterium primatium TaxID=2045438 RepID=UPI0026CB1BE0